MSADAEEECAAMREVVNRVPGMLAYWGPDQRCRFANRAYETWFGVSPEALLGKTMAELLGPLYRLNLPHIEAALRGERQTFEREIPDPHGGPSRHSQAEYIPHLVDGLVQGFIVMVTDITRQKQLEEQLRHTNQQLSRTVVELEEALRKSLSGLLPICAWCKKIRTGQGTYEDFEAFISSKTNAMLSHGICPECEVGTRV